MQVGASVFRAHPGLETLGIMGLQGAWVSRVHPALDSLDAMGRWASAGATGGTIRASRHANAWGASS